jgi:polyferredoxin
VSRINSNDKKKEKANSCTKGGKEKKATIIIMTIFVNGKQKRVKCLPTIDGMDVTDFIMNIADPIFLHQNELWEYMD